MSFTFEEKLPEIKLTMNKIFEACNHTFWKGCGSYLFDGSEYNYCADMVEKQKLLFNVAKKANKVLEIGTYMGHSASIMLAANPKIEIVAIDNMDFFAGRAIPLLRELYPESKIEFLHGDSLSILPSLSGKKFDLFHVDGHHVESYIEQEIGMISSLSDDGYVPLILDDIDICQGTVSRLKNSHQVNSWEIPDSRWTNGLFYINWKI